MSAALANDGARGFVMLLVALLAIMLFAVIRAPGFDGSSPDDATRPLPAVPARTAPVRALAERALAEPALPGAAARGHSHDVPHRRRHGPARPRGLHGQACHRRGARGRHDLPAEGLPAGRHGDRRPSPQAIR
jgi:hypothetical protein